MGLKILLIIVFSLFFSVLLSSQAFAYYLDFNANNSVMPNKNITVIGSLGNTTPETISGITINASLPNNNFTAVSTSSTGSFNLTVDTTGLASDQILTVTAGSITKHSIVRITNVTSASVTITNNPPFSPGVLLVANITAKNSSSLAVPNQNITGKVFAADGPQPAWGLNTSMTNANGIAYLNFSIPSTATLGRYMIDIENGAGTAFFVLTNYTTSVLTKDSTDNTRTTFAPGSAVTIETTIKRNDAGQPNLPVVFTVFDPNNMPTISSTFTTSSNGTASYIYSFTSTGGVYRVRINASGELVYTTFSIKTFSLSLESEEEAGFFFKFGGQKFFTPGQLVTLNIVPANVSSGALLQRDVNYFCNSTSIKITNTWNVNGTSVNSSISASSFFSTTYQMTPICAVNFALPASFIGTFGMKVNLTIGSSTETGQGYFSIQRYGLRVEPASPFGGMEMHTLLLPGDNASFKIYVFNISSGADLGSGNITNAVITKIRSLRAGGAESTSVAQRFYNATTEEDAYIEAVVPSITGPATASVTATVAGETLTGTATYMGKYLMGYAQSSGTRFGEGGGQERGGSGQFISCSGTVEFSTMVFDAKTMMPASSVTFLSLIEAREEMTGTDISGCLSITRATTDSSGRATINVTFSSSPSCSLSGFHFMMFNVSFRDKTDEIPGGFECKNLNFQPQTYISGTEGFNAKGSASVTFKVNNASYTDNSSKIATYGTVNLSRLMNFNPAVGPTLLTVKSGVVLGGGIYWDGNYYTGNITIYPANFSLTQWPSGFFDARVQVNDLNTSTSDASTGGFGSVAFETLSTWWGGCYGPPQNCQGANQNSLGSTRHAPSEEISMTLYTNLPVGTETSNTTGSALDWMNATYQGSFSNVSYVNITLTDQMSGNSYTPTNIILTLVNGSTTPFSSFGDPFVTWENYTLNFTLPANIKDGSYMGDIKITTNSSLTADEMISLEVKGLSIGLPLRETWSERWRYGDVSGYERSILNFTGNCVLPDASCEVSMTYNDTWSAANWTYIKSLYGIDNSTGNAQAAQICTKQHLNLSSEGWGNTNHLTYSVLVFTNSTNSYLFLGNRSHDYNSSTVSNIIVFNLTNNLPGTNEYLWDIADCGRVNFVNVSILMPSDRGRGTVQTDFPWGEDHMINKDFYLPFVVFTGSNTTAVRKPGYNITIKNVVTVNREGFGVGNPLSSSLWNYTSSSLTDSSGLVFVKMNVQNNSKFLAFWEVNTTPKKTGSNFKGAIKFGVRGFNAWGNFVKLLPEVSKRVVLTKTSVCTWLQNESLPSPNANVDCYNATFNEAALGERFTLQDTNQTFYFALVKDSLIDAGGTGRFRYLFIDDDPWINLTGQCVMQSWQATNEGAGCMGGGYPPKKIDMFGSSRDDWFGQGIQIGFDDVLINSTHAIITAYQSSPGLNWSTVSSSTQKIGARICAQTFAFTPVNATVNLRFANWMNGMPFSDITNITMYNLTDGASVLYPGTLSTSMYNGCFLTDLLPFSGSWTEGRNEILGTATAISGATGSEDVWSGPVEYWPNGFNM